jgi:radical SAM protein with 4Fe4S-binding SPASM domain
MPGITESKLFTKAYMRGSRLPNLAGIYADYQLSLITRRIRVKHFPPALMIEPTNICNLKCPLCPSGNGSLQRPRGMMSLDLFKGIVDQVVHKTGMLILWNQGESFLNPDFYAMIEYAARQKLYTMSSSNASLDLDIPRIIKSGLSRLIISMDGISKDTYDSYRVNGNFEKVLANLKELAKTKRILKSATPILVWQFIVMKHNEHEIDQVKRMAKSFGVDRLEFKTVQIYSKEDLKYLPSDHKLSRYSSGVDSFELKTQLLNRCRRLWTQPVINWDGEMSICCYDKDLYFKIGNIREHSFTDLWFGDAMNRMRQAVLTNRAGFEVCRNCGEGIVQKLHI